MGLRHAESPSNTPSIKPGGLESTTLVVCTSLFQSIVAVTLLSELQNGQENATSSFGFCFLGGGFDDFLLPMGH